MAETEGQLKAWMLGGLDGSSTSQTELLRALAPLLRSYFRHRMRSAEEEVEDLVQETLIAIHTRRSTYDRNLPFTAWLYAIARHRMIDHYRGQKKALSIDAVEFSLADNSFEVALDAKLDIENLLATLPLKQAHVIRGTRIEGLSIAEAAARAGIGESDVKVSVHRGLKALTSRILGSRS